MRKKWNGGGDTLDHKVDDGPLKAWGKGECRIEMIHSAKDDTQSMNEAGFMSH